MAEQDDYARYTIRIPRDQYERLAEAAATNRRSVNAELIHALYEAYPPEPTLEELIEYARDISEDYLDAPDYSRLRTLRSTLKEIKERLEHGRQHGYPKTSFEEMEDELKSEGLLPPPKA